ncbi:MAG TPA: wax ester/triacylglycerol synthase family O-acyltransferase [Solirubrobacteraceae bacterium]|jgi:WS/DGAT/MGAT family acyltransferase
MANPDRLSGLDAAFLHLEDHSTAHMHVASVMVLEGKAPSYQELVDHVLGRLHLVPRYRQRLSFVPLGQGRPVWTDDPRFNPYYHVRHTALPAPADEQALKQLSGRLFSQRLDRSKPLWEIWLVDEMAGDRFALIAKTHHALVDGISGVDITTVLFDVAPDAMHANRPPTPWVAPPSPGTAKLLADALLERTTVPTEMLRGARAMLRAPRRALSRLRESGMGLAAATLPGLEQPAPHTPFNVDIGPHRRYTWVDADLDLFKQIKDALGGTLNDVVLGSVSLALGRHLRASGHDTQGLVLKAMVPVSVRAEIERGALGNKVAAMWAPLPVGIEDPAECYAYVRDAMLDLKSSGQAVGAEALTNLAGFAPPTILSQAARLQARQRYFNLVVTNVPGPQFPLYLLRHKLLRLYPVVPLAQRQALGLAVMSYDGKLGFGLLADYDAVPAVEQIAQTLREAIDSLASAAGIRRRRSGAPKGGKSGQLTARKATKPAARKTTKPAKQHATTAPTARS